MGCVLCLCASVFLCVRSGAQMKLVAIKKPRRKDKSHISGTLTKAILERSNLKLKQIKLDL